MHWKLSQKLTVYESTNMNIPNWVQGLRIKNNIFVNGMIKKPNIRKNEIGTKYKNKQG